MNEPFCLPEESWQLVVDSLATLRERLARQSEEYRRQQEGKERAPEPPEVDPDGGATAAPREEAVVAVAA